MEGNTKNNNKSGLFWGISHTFILCGMVVAQPVYDLLSKNPEFFVAHKTLPSDIFFFAFFFSFVIPGTLAIGELLLRRISPVTGRLFHTMVIGLLVTLLALQLLKLGNGIPAQLVIFGALLLGIGSSIIYERNKKVRLYLNYISPAVLIFPIVFIFFSPISRLAFPDELVMDIGVTDSSTPVIFVIFDELPTMSLLRADLTLDRDRFPAFSDLASVSTWYRNATTVGESTMNSLAAMLTGRYPNVELLPTVQDYPGNLFTLIGPDYDMAVHEYVTRMCPQEYCKANEASKDSWTRNRFVLRDSAIAYLHIVLPESIAKEHLPPINEGWKDFVSTAGSREDWTKMTRDELVAYGRNELQKMGAFDWNKGFESAIQEIYRDRKQYLFFMHVQLPHIPWRYLPSGKQYLDTRTDGIEDEGWKNNKWLVYQGMQRHLLQLAYVDKLLGELLSRLRDTGSFDNALVLVTADHGASFRVDAHRRALEEKNIVDIISIPLFIKYPFQREAHISDKYVQTIDIVPTIADVLGVSVPWETDGHSLVKEASVDRSNLRIFANKGHQFNVSTRRLAERNSILELKESLFNNSDAPASFYSMGEFGGLVGRKVDDFPVVDESSWTVELKKQRDYQYGEAGVYSPARISGSIDGRGRSSEGMPLLVAINGVIGGVSQTYIRADTEKAVFSSMVMEDLFLPGDNMIDVFSPSYRDDGSIVLRKYALKKSGGGSIRINYTKRVD